MESAGAVFLPAAGYRDETKVIFSGLIGYYWSSTQYDSDYAYILYFETTYLGPQDYYYRGGGRSVRLVHVLTNWRVSAELTWLHTVPHIVQKSTKSLLKSSEMA